MSYQQEIVVFTFLAPPVHNHKQKNAWEQKWSWFV